MSMERFQVLRLTQEAYDQLALFARENPQAYLDSGTDFDRVLLERGVTDYTEETGISSDRPIALTPMQNGPANRADRQALDFHRSLPDMTPNAATDGLVWTWMTHFRLHSYSIKRWRLQGDLTNHIRNHWFVGNESDALRQNNTASRTWWIANTAIKAAKASGGAFTEEAAIEHFANNPRHYHNMMDSNFSRNPFVCAEILLALMTEARGRLRSWFRPTMEAHEPICWNSPLGRNAQRALEGTHQPPCRRNNVSARVRGRPCPTSQSGPLACT